MKKDCRPLPNELDGKASAHHATLLTSITEGASGATSSDGQKVLAVDFDGTGRIEKIQDASGQLTNFGHAESGKRFPKTFLTRTVS